MKTRTSETDPIRVDYLPQHLVGLRGRIGMTFAPGKKDHGAFAVWMRSLDADLGRLQGVYRTDVLISLVEDEELHAVSISDLVPQAASRGLEVRRFPFHDGGIPARLEDGEAIVASVIEVARAGGNVVIHCRGGLGRTGLIAACALVALGHSAADAIAAVRAARTGTIENTPQEAFVARFGDARRGWLRGDSPAGAASHPPHSRYRGCLLGGAIGDALGYPIEFETSAASIFSARGRTAPRDLRDGRGVALVSDDTQMSLFVAEGVIRGLQRMSNRGVSSMETTTWLALRRWYGTQVGRAAEGSPEDAGWLVGVRRLHAGRAPGNTCMSSLSAAAAGAPRPTVATPPNSSKGCGAVMRSAPIGLAAGTRELAFELARDTGVTTHGHPSGYLSAAYFASVIYDVARGVSLRDAMDLADQLLAAEKGHEELSRVVARVRDAVANGPPTPDAIEALGGGWTGEEALGIGLLCALTADGGTQAGVADALWRSVAHAGDSDSTGSITGNLLGAMHGAEALPARWLKQVELRDVIDRVADDLYAVSALGCVLDYGSYPPN